MVPVLLRTNRQLLPPFHQQHAGVTDISRPTLTQPAEGEGAFISKDDP